MMWLILFLVLVAGLLYLPVFLEKRRRPIDDAARREAPGKFAKLSKGQTHYRWVGPVRGPVAVMIHGLTTNSAVWKDISEGMADIGYRVLEYDLYGRGYSDAVAAPHDMQLYLTQLDELLGSQELEDGLTLIGYSMGGAIATAFAAREPHRMRRLIVLGTAGVETNESDFSKFCRTRPIIGDWLHGTVAGYRIARSIKDGAAAGVPGHILEAQRQDLGRQGYLSSVLSARRGALTVSQEPEHRAITRDGIPTIAVWGEDDDVVPVSAVGLLAQWNRIAHQETVPGAGHSLPYTHPEAVNDVLRKMLRGE